ncbi:DJ-1/PfpI family protein [Candidatus Neptunichlamydia sp. REUL1]|uniref:DJ-1/PfpI family protein n=1 Tax=Candidatus Neptunichlamydia sp. REUL1 TaxID=3064277 RepID=UPI00292F8D6F|nr:DJ-1/PfpI family protein [Candidatus Neptunochlamydia sp. REUL1]
MKKIVALVHEIFEDLELMYPVIRIKEGGIKVVIAGEEEETVYHGKHGYPCKSTAAFRDINPSEFDGVLIPGGFAPDKFRRIQDSPLVIDGHLISSRTPKDLPIFGKAIVEALS